MRGLLARGNDLAPALIDDDYIVETQLKFHRFGALEPNPYLNTKRACDSPPAAHASERARLYARAAGGRAWGGGRGEHSL